jgi:hypothetical protein
MQMSSLITQSMVGLFPGRLYELSWNQRNRPGFYWSYNDLNVKVDSVTIYNQIQVTDEQWTSKSVVFTAQTTSQNITFITTAACGGDCTLFLDTIAVDVVPDQIIIDGGFESYDYQMSSNTGYGKKEFLGPGTPLIHLL